jgi:hypothetical protein
MEPTMHFLINGKSFDFDLDVRISLLDLLARNCLASGTLKTAGRPGYKHFRKPWEPSTVKVVNSIQIDIVDRHTIDVGRVSAAAAAPHFVSPAF